MAQLLEKKMEEKPGHPLFLAKQAANGGLSDAEKAAFKQKAMNAEIVDDAGEVTNFTRHVKGQVRAGDCMKVLLPEKGLRLDMGSCSTDGGHESWATLLVLKKTSDEGSDAAVMYGDEFGIFSSENGSRLDAGHATADEGHDTWATVFEVKRIDGGKNLRCGIVVYP